MFRFLKKEKTFFKKTRNKLKKTIKIIGPGFVTGSADDDPSGIGTYSVAAAKYGLLFAWLAPFLLPFMFVIQEMCSRIGLVTGNGLVTNMKKFVSKYIISSIIILLFFANTINIAADISIMSSSIKMLVGGNLKLWAILLAIFIILTEVFISYYFYSRILLGLAIFLLAYIITALMTTQNWFEVFKFTFIPHFEFNKDFIVMLIAFIGTTISPYLFFWQTSYEIDDTQGIVDKNQSKKLKEILIKETRKGSFMGMFFSQIIALSVVITCFSALHKNGITKISTAQDAAMALRPFAGEWAYLIFTIGIIGAGFLGISVLAGSSAYATSQLFDKPHGLSNKFKDAPFFYIIIIISILIGLVISFIGISPIKALVYAAVINGVTSVPIIAFILILANKKEIMGKYKNGIISNILGYFLCFVMFLGSIMLFL